MKIEKSAYFKTWTNGDLRILKDAASKSFYPYEVQQYNGKTWDKVEAFHTLKEAKAVIA